MKLVSSTVTDLITLLLAEHRLPSSWTAPTGSSDFAISQPRTRYSRQRLISGSALHNALEDSAYGIWVGKSTWRYVSAIQSWLDALNPTRTFAEWDLGRELRGRADIFVLGGDLNRKGFIEIKTTPFALPDAPRARDVCQLAMYPVADQGVYADYFGALLYVSVGTGQARVFTWNSMLAPCHQARRLAIAA